MQWTTRYLPSTVSKIGTLGPHALSSRVPFLETVTCTSYAETWNFMALQVLSFEEIHSFEGNVFDDEGMFHPRAADEDADAPPLYEFFYATAQEVDKCPQTLKPALTSFGHGEIAVRTR
ncbi:hypothetical protein LTR17_016731 [Elasticomyces elasticus]|nr:hypothetical protein LTR17_016731 [Elasticomyces elasticus]